MGKNEHIGILFIGNSHTYYNDMPLMVQKRAVEERYDCSVFMIAHGGWYLRQHAEEPEVRFNILHGNFDYIVLQEHAHPFSPEEEYYDAVCRLGEWIKQAGSTPVIYSCWAEKLKPHDQEHMNDINRQAAAKIGALLAPVGENWWSYHRSWPELEMYAEDGQHASRAGSDFAAKYIWETIHSDLFRKKTFRKQ